MTDNTPARVLLVDDRPENLLALEAVLGDLGVTLVRAASGHEALKRLLDADFAAVILDVQMPGVGGFEVARLMRARPRSKSTPVIFVTADTSPDSSVREAYTLGAVDFLVKPVVPEVLRAKVAVFTELHRLRDAERRRSEAALRDSEAWLRTVTDSVPVLLAYLDRDLRYRFANARYEEWFGLPPAEVSGRELRAVVGDDVFAQRRPFLDQALAGRAVRFDGPTRHHRLGLRDTEVSYTPHVVAGAVRGFFSVVQDITDRTRAEAAHRAVVETALDCVIGMDHAGRVTEFNPAAERTFGFSREEALGRDMGALIIPAEFRAAHRAGLARYLATGEEHVLRRRLELPAVRRDGGRFPCELSITRNPGEPPSFTGFLRDITERKQAEDALREASRRKDEFLATLAHELRNPLAPLRNAAGILRLGPTPAQVERLVGMMDRQLGHLAHLVDDLLDVARVTTGRITLRPERLDLREAVDAAVETVRPAAEAARHDLAVNLPAGPLPIDGDRTRLAQVFTNLLTNACKYTPPGGRIVLAAEPDGEAVVVRVSDTGVGIPADMLPRVFEVFTQVDRSLDRAQGGLGLGLALVKTLVGMHGGEVWAESPGSDRGSTFWVRLPLAADPADRGG